MIYLPPLRRLLLPAIVLLALIVFYRSHLQGHAFPPLILHPSPAPPEGIHRSIATLKTNSLPIFNATHNHLSPPKQYYYSETKATNKTLADSLTSPLLNPALDVLFKCALEPNKYTGHIRLPNIVQNISQIQAGSKSDGRVFWNPTIISLPYWSKNQYLVVSRIVTDGNHQENVLCEANVCYVGSENDARPGEMPCTEDDLLHVSPAGGMRCATPVTTLSVPPTPAEHCEGKFNSYVDIPGFHDPRIFWSGRGEPLMMVNTQSALPSTASPILFSPLIQADIPLLDRSRYACFGLWLIDLRTLHPPLSRLLTVSPTRPSLGPLKSYASLTELTRNPPSTRSPIEKNWMLFFPSTGESYVHYDLSGPRSGRTFAKLLGNGLTTSNLTDPLEEPCLRNLDKEETDEKKKGGTFHQATNSLRLILCNRSDKDTEKGCKPTDQNTVFFALIHRKFPNFLKLPLRYERYFIVWSASPPFSMLGVSKYPLLMANETASGWTQSQNWDDDPTNRKHVTSTKKLQQAENIGAFKNRDGGKAVVKNATEPYGGRGYWAYFTYTVSISYAWGREGDEVGDKNVGYLDDEVVLGIGVDDKGQGFARVKAGDLVGCLRACPGREG